MKNENSFFQSVCTLAVPVALQFMLQASFSIIDQIMIGQLGSVSVAALGLAAKFSSVFTFLVSAIGAVAGVMLSQYMGQKNRPALRRSFFLNLQVSLALAGVFTILCLFFPRQIMGLYTSDPLPAKAAASYLFLIAGTFFPIAGATLLATLLRCMDKAALPLYASIFAAVLNTGLNYVLIFGRGGFPAMGVRGAAVASVIAQAAAYGVTVVYFCRDAVFRSYFERGRVGVLLRLTREARIQYLGILAPILVCEFMWSLGENMYAVIYGRMGTAPCAAMTMTGPIQGLMIGLLSGVAQAAGIMIGRHLGKEDYETAYKDSKKLMGCGAAGSAALSLLLVWLGGAYVSLYNVEPQVQRMTYSILSVFALISPIKVQNMILGGGIIRSGGMTRYVMWIDMIGTWLFGVPIGFLAAFVWELPIPQVYLMLSLEEIVRLLISLAVFRKKSWMRRL